MRTGLKLALLLPLFALMAPTGGFPSRPTFQAVKVNGTAAGNVVIASSPGSTGIQITSTAGASDESLHVDIPATDAFYFGSNNSGSTNAIGAATGTDYIYTNQARPVVIGTSGIARFSIGAAGLVSSLSADNLEATLVNDTSGSPASGIYSGWHNNGTLIGLIATGGVAGAPCTLNDFCIATQVTGKNLNLYTVGTGQIKLTGQINAGTALNFQQPFISFDANLIVGPSILTCHYCQATPTVVRNSAGNFTLQPQSTGNYHWACTYRNNSTAPGGIAINSLTAGGLVLLTYTAAGALSDVQGTVECIGIA